ncbi:MAG: MFS transporter [Chloroflexi bacterium]|jgi:hypothetical protein|nr:MFS transporter [Chloroflexota bacterium]
MLRLLGKLWRCTSAVAEVRRTSRAKRQLYLSISGDGTTISEFLGQHSSIGNGRINTGLHRTTFTADLAPTDMRGRYLSVFALTWGVASGIGPVVGGILNDWVNPHAIWYGGGAFGIIAALWFGGQLGKKGYKPHRLIGRKCAEILFVTLSDSEGSSTAQALRWMLRLRLSMTLFDLHTFYTRATT